MAKNQESSCGDVPALKAQNEGLRRHFDIGLSHVHTKLDRVESKVDGNVERTYDIQAKQFEDRTKAETLERRLTWLATGVFSGIAMAFVGLVSVVAYFIQKHGL